MAANAWSVIEITIDLLDSLLILLLLTSSLRLRYDNKWMWMLYTVSLALICAGANSICTSMAQLLMVLCIVLLLFTVFLTVGHFYIKLIWTLLTPLVFFGVDMLYTSIILKILSGIPSEAIYEQGPLRLFNMVVSRLLIAAVVLVIRKRKIIVSASLPLASLLIGCLALSFLSMLLLAALFARDHIFDNYMVASLFMICAVNILYIYLFFSLKARDETISEDALVIQKLEYDQSKYLNASRSIEELQGWKHDMRKHMQALLSISQSQAEDKNEQIASYLSEIEKGLDVTRVFIDTGNTLFDSIISSYSIQASDQNIDVQLEMIVPQLSFIDPTDLCSILGNMWDNAIEGCLCARESGKEPVSIGFKTFVNANHFIMELSNTSVTDSEAGLKTNKSTPGHGIGIKSIQKLTNKYHGIYDFDAQEGLFVTHIAIPVNAKSPDSLDRCTIINWRNGR